MLIFLNSDGTIAGEELYPAVNQGSMFANEIKLVAPFPTAIITVAYTLPNGITLGPQLIPPTETERISGSDYVMTKALDVPGYTVDGATLSVFTYKINAMLTAQSGDVKIQFFIYVGGALIASPLVVLPVNNGVNNLVIPEAFSSNIYTDILNSLSGVNTILNRVDDLAEAAAGRAETAEGNAEAAADSALNAQYNAEAAAARAELAPVYDYIFTSEDDLIADIDKIHGKVLVKGIEIGEPLTFPNSDPTDIKEAGLVVFEDCTLLAPDEHNPDRKINLNGWSAEGLNCAEPNELNGEILYATVTNGFIVSDFRGYGKIVNTERLVHSSFSYADTCLFVFKSEVHSWYGPGRLIHCSRISYVSGYAVYEDCSALSYIESESTYINCVYVDPYTCIGFVAQENAEGKIPLLNEDGYFETLDNPKGLGKYSTQLGKNTLAGSKAFTVTAYNSELRSFTLDSIAGLDGTRLEEGDVYSCHLLFDNDSALQFENVGEITRIVGTTVYVDVFPDVKGRGLKTLDSYIDENGIDTERNTFRIIAKPEVGTRTIGDGTFTSGVNTQALSKGAVSFGKDNLSYGSYSYTDGTGNEAGYCARADGRGCKAPGELSRAGGDGTIASGLCSETGGEGTKASGRAARAHGRGTIASGHLSNAQGEYTEASGYGSNAQGRYTVASGSGASASGQSTKASGVAADAQGFTTIAGGERSSARGSRTYAGGFASSAEGVGNNVDINTPGTAGAFGYGSHVEGCMTVAKSDYQHAQGKYNIEDSSNTYAHIVGNGTSDSKRSNAHTVDWKGNAWYAGDVYVGGAGQGEGEKLVKTSEVARLEEMIAALTSKYESLLAQVSQLQAQLTQ